MHTEPHESPFRARRTVRVMLVDDRPLMRNGIASLLRGPRPSGLRPPQP